MIGYRSHTFQIQAHRAERVATHGRIAASNRGPRRYTAKALLAHGVRHRLFGLSGYSSTRRMTLSGQIYLANMAISDTEKLD